MFYRIEIKDFKFILKISLIQNSFLDFWELQVSGGW